MVIWDYDIPAAARSLGWAVVANNIEAMKILLDCGYVPAAILAGSGALSRWVVARSILWAVGLEGMDSSGDQGMAADTKAFWTFLEKVQMWGGNIGYG